MKKIETAATETLPLFARLLDSSPTEIGGGGGPRPTYNCYDNECTKKYPSDDDDSYPGGPML